MDRQRLFDQYGKCSDLGSFYHSEIYTALRPVIKEMLDSGVDFTDIRSLCLESVSMISIIESTEAANNARNSEGTEGVEISQMKLRGGLEKTKEGTFTVSPDFVDSLERDIFEGRLQTIRWSFVDSLARRRELREILKKK